MMWADFYLICFMVGLGLSVLSFLGAVAHIPHVHLHLPHAHAPAHAGAPHPGTVAHGHGSKIPFFNFASLTAFLAWFGGTGYLLTRYSTLVVAVVLLLAIAAGLAGAAIIFWYLVKFLLRHEQELDPADYDRIGVLARITSSIRAGGTGEIVFSQGGTRQTCGARSEDGEPIARGTEVIITRYEHGIAYVRRWDQLEDGKQAG